MGYRIQYGPVRKIRRSEHRRSGTVALTGLFLLFLLMVNLFWSEGVQVIRESLLPKEHSVTVSAMEDMSDALVQGESAYEAVRTFLKSILNDGIVHSD